jgi:hypothetical protein
MCVILSKDITIGFIVEKNYFPAVRRGLRREKRKKGKGQKSKSIKGY